ncbi:glycosyltransferase family 2 protein [Pontibacter pamirensis]|uniref:glycosyltransferase family 2 protein n=1 Tax=Pontibacter pamirensis TaxID=2562824 RepID=UPI00138A50A8|nr:glycosyltransferase family 2 protein [Pontibacter pamirensis]
MHVFNFPSWVNQFRYPYKRFEEIPSAVFEAINRDLIRVQSNDPLVSIIITAWNEETNILHCLASLSKTKTSIPFEIIVVNNNSTDKTQEVLDRLHVKSTFQDIQGWGPARQAGLENAKGKYVLLADADCLYPACWVDEMMKELQRPGIVCVYGRYSFIPEPGFPRWKLFLMERLKDTIAEVRHLKRPYLNAYGMSMGYVKEYGLKVGYVMHKIRGEDGRMCYDLMQFGKVKQVKASRARIWTSPRTLQQDGSFGEALRTRTYKELKRATTMLKPLPLHDTKTSTNE